MLENLIPSGVMPDDLWAKLIIEFYCDWLRHGCPESHEDKVNENTKFMVRRNMGKLVLLVSIDSCAGDRRLQPAGECAPSSNFLGPN